jgi:2-polyprenyl-6-methoxyphenol hydroxylase-like FAD-dependent oxidoreductase
LSLTLKGEYQLHSPCEHVELPQTLLEPIFLRYAAQHGFPCRFSTEFLLLEDDTKAKMVVSIVKDRITGTTYKIRSRYVFGADGARSRIASQLDLPMTVKPGQGVALNVLIKADLSKFIKTRTGNLHWIIQPDVESPDFAWWAIVRMVKPWSEWLIILSYKSTCDPDFTPTDHQILKHVSRLLGDESVEVDLLRVDKWRINETYANEYSKGGV